MLQPLSDKELAPMFRKYYKLFTNSSRAPSIKIFKFGDGANQNKVLNYDRVIIYYPTERTPRGLFGHYVCMCRDNRNKIYYYFDPVGSKPDATKLEAEDGLYHPYESLAQSLLTRLQSSDWQLDFSNHHLQPKGNSDSCGYWCILRLIFANLSGDQFAHQVRDWAKLGGYRNAEDFVQHLFR